MLKKQPPVGGINKAYHYRLYPNQEQQKYLDHTFHAVRKTWNVLLDRATKVYQAYKADPSLDKPGVSGFDFVNRATLLKYEEGLEWLSEVSSQALNQKALDLGNAYRSFFKRSGYPRFKSVFRPQSFRLMKADFKLEGGKMILPKLKLPIKVRWSRDLPSLPSQLTLSKDRVGHYHVSFLCLVTPVPTNGTEHIAIDLGVKDLCVLSDGTRISNPKKYLELQDKLARLQRQHEKSKKDGKNREKLRIKIAKVYKRIRNYTLDLLHKLTTSLVRRSKAIVIEDLNVAGMVLNHHLARHIIGAQFGTIRRLLEYKCRASSWCNVVIADRFMPSTNKCSVCGLKPSVKLKLETRKWTCEHCQAVHDRDYNASLNLLKVLEYGYVSKAMDEYPGSVIRANQRPEIA